MPDQPFESSAADSAAVNTAAPASEGEQPARPLRDTNRLARLAPLAVVALFVVAILRAAWVSDDAFIALRALDNLVHGYGFVSNPPERVQAFTCPLWLLVLAGPYVLIRDAYFAAIVTSLLVSMLAVALLLLGVVRRSLAAVVVGGVLTFSRAFTDYSTSGLENPLTHVLLAVFLLLYFSTASPRRLSPWLILTTALLALTRLDLTVLVLPATIEYLVRNRKEVSFRLALLGALPLVAWESFAIIYYGFPLPNTAYAKLNTALPRTMIVGQGLAYLFDSLSRDPLTLVSILLAAVGGVLVAERRGVALVVGIALHLSYVVYVGGDFMSGRFLTAPLALACALLGRSVLGAVGPWTTSAIAGILVVVILSAPYNPLRHANEPCGVPDHGVTDERSCYYDHTGLVHNLHLEGPPKTWAYQSHDYWKDGVDRRNARLPVVESIRVGMTGMAAGPKVHLVDASALTDPFLSHLDFVIRPVEHGHWRIGHYYRDLPEGYVETLREQRNLVKDPCLHRFYDALSDVVRGPIWTRKRWKTIALMNAGRYNGLLARDCSSTDLSAAQGLPWSAHALAASRLGRARG